MYPSTEHDEPTTNETTPMPGISELLIQTCMK